MAEIQLTRRHDGQTVMARVGSRVTLQLDETPTTGYRWVDRSDGDALTPAGDEFTPPAPGVPGAGGQHCFRYTVRRPGTAHLRLVLMQPWADDSSAVDRCAVTIHAVAA